MTGKDTVVDAHPEQEYIITGRQIIALRLELDKSVVDALCSRPHLISPLTQDTTGHFVSGQSTSPPVCSGGGFAEHWTAKEARKKRDGEIRQDEREKVLKILETWSHDLNDSRWRSMDALRAEIQALRPKDGEQ